MGMYSACIIMYMWTTIISNTCISPRTKHLWYLLAFEMSGFHFPLTWSDKVLNGFLTVYRSSSRLLFRMVLLCVFMQSTPGTIRLSTDFAWEGGFFMLTSAIALWTRYISGCYVAWTQNRLAECVFLQFSCVCTVTRKLVCWFQNLWRGMCYFWDLSSRRSRFHSLGKLMIWANRRSRRVCRVLCLSRCIRLVNLFQGKRRFHGLGRLIILCNSRSRRICRALCYSRCIRLIVWVFFQGERALTFALGYLGNFLDARTFWSLNCLFQALGGPTTWWEALFWGW